jgi:hypothetical protein
MKTLIVIFILALISIAFEVYPHSYAARWPAKAAREGLAFRVVSQFENYLASRDPANHDGGTDYVGGTLFAFRASGISQVFVHAGRAIYPR